MRKTMKIMIGILIFTFIITIDEVPIDVLADNDNKPVLEVYQEGDGVKAEWAVEILDEDVLYNTGFETGDLLPNLHYSGSHNILPENRWYGGQSFTTEDKYDGSYSLRIHDSYNNGNIFSTKLDGSYSISGNDSWSDFNGSRFHMSNNTDLSLSFRAKTTGNGDVRFTGTGGAADYGTPLNETFLEDVKVGDKTVKVSNISTFKSSVDKGNKYYLALSKGRYSYGYVTEYDDKNSTITLSRGYLGTFKKGENILRHYHRSPVSFNSRGIHKKDDWQLFNVNTKVNNYADYNTLNRGFYLTIRTTTRDVVYIDDVKVGYATLTELHRDGQRIYEGYLSDYQDDKATDKASPEPVSDYVIERTLDNQYINLATPLDKGTSYEYQVKAVSNGNNVYESEKKDIEVKSGIKGYSYTIGNENVNPDGNVNNTNGKIEIPKGSKEYIHIIAVDNAGNKSKKVTYKISELEKELPTIKFRSLPSEWTNQNVRYGMYYEPGNEGYESELLYYNGEKIGSLGESDNGRWFELAKNRTDTFKVVDKKGNMNMYEVVIDTIDKIKPELQVNKSTDDWVRSLDIVASVIDKQSGPRGTGVFRDDYEKNLISINNTHEYKGFIEKDNLNVKIIDKPGDRFSGLMIPNTLMEKDNDYVLSYEIRSISGALDQVGGMIATTNKSELYVDGKRVGANLAHPYNGPSSIDDFPKVNDGEFHKIEVKFNVNDLSVSDKNIYIQPNRQVEVPYVAEVRNIQLEKGTEVTPYTPHLADTQLKSSPAKFNITENGVYDVVGVDNAGNITSKSIEIANIDKNDPKVEIIPNETKQTHENVVLNVNAEDDESGIKSVMYIGDNVIKNGNFKDGLKHWHEDKPIPDNLGGGDIILKNKHLYLADNRVNVNKAEQRDVFIDTAIGTKFYAEIEAKGVGIVNARYAKHSGPHQVDYAQNLKSSTEFNKYKFGIERGENSRDVFMIERRSKDGWIEVKDVKVFAQKDITDTRKLEITQNGTYTFVVEDYAGNLTTKSITISNIDKSIKLTKPKIIDFPKATIGNQSSTNISDLIIEDWRDKSGNWKLQVEATRLTNGKQALPGGTLQLKGINNVNIIEDSRDTPKITYEGFKSIDEGSVVILESNNARGKYGLNFAPESLRVNLNESIAKGLYETKITWSIIEAP